MPIINFLSAVQDCHTDMLELDCHLTADGRVVVCHDDHLNEIAGINRKILDFDYTDLPDLKRRTPMHRMRPGSFHASGVNVRISARDNNE